MSRPLALSPFLAGDPVTAGAEVASVAGVLQGLGLDAEAAGAMPLGAGVVLVHALRGERGDLSLRWVRLPHAPALAAGCAPADIAIVVVGPLVDISCALRLVARLRACLRDPEVLARGRAALTREELARVLASAEHGAGEAPLRGEELLALVGSTPDGLTSPEAARRAALCGANRLERVRPRSLASRFLEQFWSFFALLLWVGGGLAFVAGMSELGWAIFAVIIVNGVFSFFQEYRAERAVQALQDLLPHVVDVMRDGRPARLPAAAVLPGDVVRVEEGDQVPADGQLLSAEGLRVDQSALTGEAHPVFKLPAGADERAGVPRLERHELLFAGTGVVAGSGTFVVAATAMATEIGGIAHLTQAVGDSPSPLQREMARVTRIVTGMAVSLGLVFLVLDLALGLLPAAEGLLFALGVIVANVPEGLLPTLTLALAMGAQRMARQRSVMKRLSSVETLGATTVICTDKTGTLTQNRMTARFVWASGRIVLATDLPSGAGPDVRELFEVAALASQAMLEHGDPTEVALVAAGAQAGVDPAKIRDEHPLLAPYPFDSFRKRMTLVRAAASGPQAYVKGAPKETLALCASVRWDGGTRPLTDELRSRIMADHDGLAGEGLRVLAVATRAVDQALVGAAPAAVERELTLLGLVALWDPPRPEVEPAIRLCERAGVRVLMVTGDYGLTAQAIARQIGLRVEKVVTGEEVERLSPEALRGLAAGRDVVFARMSPAHKLALVTELKRLGETVAVTGDGVNDAPALKAADIGVAMGRRGSEVAKEAAVMVIADDNFASIVGAVREGRAIYANMGKFITYIFASNVPELVPFLALAFLGVPLPLTVMQILAVDLGTDLLPALALGAEPPEPDVMDRPPRPRGERLLGASRLLHAYGFLGVLEAGLSLLGFFWTYWLAGWRPGLAMVGTGRLYRRATTMTLAGIVASQVGNVMACRTERESVFRAGLVGNRLVLLGILAEVSILLLFILVPPFAAVFGLERLAAAEWGLLLAFPPAVLAAEEARKLALRSWARRRSRTRRATCGWTG